MNDLILSTKEELINELWKADPKIKKIFRGAENLPDARKKLFDYLNDLERHFFNIYSDRKLKDFHIIEKKNAKECIKVFKNVIRTENELMTGFSALRKLIELSKDNPEKKDVLEGFLTEFIALFKGINAISGVIDDKFVLPTDNKQASALRSQKLDEYSGLMNSYLQKFKTGSDPGLTKIRSAAKKNILKHFNADENDWNDHKWQMRHIIKDLKGLESLVNLDKEEREGLEAAEKFHIPFQITPYYLSLFNPFGKTKDDRAVRAQVLPSAYYSKHVYENRTAGIDMDFMGEHSTSPVEAITRRYPQIVILKPIDICPQICVYCQRNWEIKPLKESKSSRRTIANAIEWIKNNENIAEVLITGGDPFILHDDYIEQLLHDVSEIKHVERIRIGTRVLATLPMRITDDLVKILATYHKPGLREICIVTHFEHPTEITPESIKATTKIRRAGISIYNQQVFTYFNSARFESSALRKALKLSGIDPYYTFNTKGKQETEDFRVPMARIQQERKEEARFLPGLVRTDEPVFNVPKLGKSHLRAWQDHELIMIRDDGQRVYRFYPWESRVTLVDDYIYTDVSIYDYLKKLKYDGEDMNDYRSIWYYF